MNVPKFLSWTTGLALALTTATLVAQGYGYGPMMGGGRWQGQNVYCGPFYRYLNLTESQQTQLNTIEERHQAALDAKFRAQDESQLALQEALSDPSVSDAKVKELRIQMADAQTAVLLEQRAIERESQAVLTPDQRTALGRYGRRGYGRGMMGYGWMGGGWGMGPGRGGCGYYGGY